MYIYFTYIYLEYFFVIYKNKFLLCFNFPIFLDYDYFYKNFYISLKIETEIFNNFW